MNWGAAVRLPDEPPAPAAASPSAASAGAAACASRWFRPATEQRTAAALAAERWVLFLPGTGAFARWQVVVPCVAVQCCLGSIYSWSLFNAAMDTGVWGTPGTNALGFLVSVAVYGACTFFLGAHIQRIGPFAAVARTALLLPTAWAAAAASSAAGSLAGLFFGYGLLIGVATAHAYLATTSTMQRWFPERKGLAAGIAVAGFGVGAFGWTMLGKLLLSSAHGVSQVQLVFAVATLVILLLALPFMRLPPPGWQPRLALAANAAAAAAAAAPATPVKDASSAAAAAAAAASAAAAAPAPPPSATCRSPDRVYTFAEAASTLEFWLLAVIVFGCSCPGIVFLSSSADMAMFAFSLSAANAFSVTAAQNAINFCGRLGFGSLSDRLGRKSFYVIAASAQAAALAIMPAAVRGGALGLWLAAFLTIGACYGGTFGVLPALTSELFGPGISSATHGSMVSFWALSAVVGIPVFTRITATHTLTAVSPATGAATTHPAPEAYALNAEWLLALPLLALLATLALNTRTRDRILRRARAQLRLRLPAGRVAVIDAPAPAPDGVSPAAAAAAAAAAPWWRRRPRLRVLGAEAQADEWAAYLRDLAAGAAPGEAGSVAAVGAAAAAAGAGDAELVTVVLSPLAVALPLHAR